MSSPERDSTREARIEAAAKAIANTHCPWREPSAAERRWSRYLAEVALAAADAIPVPHRIPMYRHEIATSKGAAAL